MFKILLTSLLLIFLVFACAKNEKKIASEPSETDVIVSIYTEAVEALKRGDAYYAAKQFKEVESMLPQTEWAAKASLMASYAHYSRNAYTRSIFSLETHITNYPADENIVVSMAIFH